MMIGNAAEARDQLTAALDGLRRGGGDVDILLTASLMLALGNSLTALVRVLGSVMASCFSYLFLGG
jgi:hypothetical protein